MVSRFFTNVVCLSLWLCILHFIIEIEFVYSQTAETTLSPYACPVMHGKGKHQSPRETLPPAKRISLRKRATKTDCWYHIIQKVNELPRRGKVLVVTDIDNTLIKKNSNPDCVTFSALPAAVDAINWLQSASALDVIALTARSFKPANVDITEWNLESANIRMLLPDMKPVLTKEQSEELSKKHRHLHFRNNILYAPNGEKVQILNSFLSVKSAKYSHIVFIDDLIENCEYVLHSLDCEADKVTVFHFTKPRKPQCLKRHSHEWPPFPSPEPSSMNNDSSESQSQN